MFKNVVVSFRTEEVLAEYEDALNNALRRVAFLVADETTERIVENNQIDTGAMKASVFVGGEGTLTMTRDQSISEAKSAAKNPGRKSGRTFDFVPVRQAWRPKGKLDVKVALSANYAVYQERRIKFLAPSLDFARGKATEIVRDEFSKIR